jgi:hypothetical protein
MATIVNNPAPSSDSSGGVGMIVGLLLLLLVGFLFFVYGLPMLRQSTASPSITVPDKINVNVNPGTGGGAK